MVNLELEEGPFGTAVSAGVLVSPQYSQAEMEVQDQTSFRDVSHVSEVRGGANRR